MFILNQVRGLILGIRGFIGKEWAIKLSEINPPQVHRCLIVCYPNTCLRRGGGRGRWVRDFPMIKYKVSNKQHVVDAFKFLQIKHETTWLSYNQPDCLVFFAYNNQSETSGTTQFLYKPNKFSTIKITQQLGKRANSEMIYILAILNTVKLQLTFVNITLF